jgi:HlyD family secretion protein
MKRINWKQGVFFAVLALLGTTVVVRAMSGSQTLATSREVIKAERQVKPKEGADERAETPKGNFIAGNGVVEPLDRETKVSASTQGRIAAILVTEGQVVEKGAPLVQLDNDAERASYEASEGDYAVAQAEYARAARGLRREDVDAVIADTDSTKARASISTSTLDRVETLSKSGSATPDELDRARNQANADKSAVLAAEARKRAALAGSRAEDVMVAAARVKAAGARREQAKATLERLTVKAPIAGKVLQVRYRAGEYFNPLGAESLVVMGDTSKLRVRMDVDERDIAGIEVGSTAFATAIALPGKRFEGKVVETGRRMGRKNIRTDDPVERIDTKILEVVVELNSTEGLLLPGLRVTSYVNKK